MKISIGAVAALVVGSASGFSITMSSYLDGLASGSTLTSFSPGGGAAVAEPPSYSAPPSYAAPPPANGTPSSYSPAPAPYKSSLADYPASSTINYIGTIGGGSQMKSGPNFSGVSKSFRASNSVVSNNVYLSNLKQGAVTSFANGAPVNGFTAPANGAPAPTSFAPAPPAPAPYQGAAASAPASTTLNYIGSIGGGSQMKPGPNYTGMSSSFQATSSVSNSVYLDNIAGQSVSTFAPANGASAPAPAAPYQSSFAPAPAPAYTSSAPAPYGGRNSYMPQPSGRVANSGIGSYLDALK